MAKASPQQAEGAETPAAWLRAVGEGHPSMLWESTHWVLGYLQAFRYSQDIPVPSWRERSAPPMAMLTKSLLAHNQGLVPLVHSSSFTP